MGEEKMKVLLAEDDLPTQEMMKDLFFTMNFELSIANDGNQAVEQFSKEKFQVVFLDIQMPNKDGVQAVQEMRALEKDGKKTSIYALTASADPSELERIKTSGFNGVVSKPIQIAEIRKLVEESKGS